MGSLSGNTSSSKSTTTNQYAIDQYNAAKQALPSSYGWLDPSRIQSYMNPYTDSVIDANTAYAHQQQQQAINANHDAAVKAGAFGGSGMARADALTQGQFDLNNQQMAANLRNQGYQSALSTATTENSAANAYLIQLQQLLGQLAQGTQTTTRGSQSSLGFGASASSAAPVNGFNLGSQTKVGSPSQLSDFVDMF